MAFRAVRSWTLGGLIMAFVDLAIAYTLLCGSAFAFVPSKLLSFFGLYVPCPCTGFFGYQNNDLCLHKLLIDLPIRKINVVQELAKNRFPFDLIWFDHQSCKLHVVEVGNRKRGSGVIELEGEACCSSLSGPRFSSSVDGETGCDAKGKKIMIQKHKPGFWRRRRPSLGYGNLSPALSSNSTHLVSMGVPHPLYDGSEIRSEIGSSTDLGSRIEDGLLGLGDQYPNDTNSSERIRDNFDLDGSYENGQGINMDQLLVEKLIYIDEHRCCGIGNIANVIQVLEKSLEEERAACAALYQELEKERAAAATAADEAMAMIFRLQEDKALIEMEARQYHRVIEEKFVYDEEEMNILKEILVRREIEIHFLEKQVEAYEQMNFLGNELVEVDSSHKIYNKEQGPSPPIDSNENPLPMQPQIDNCRSIDEKEVAISTKWSSKYDHIKPLALGKELEHKELASGISTSVSEEEPKAEREISVILPAMEAPQTCGSIGEELEKGGEHWSQVDGNAHSSMIDTESAVYDVHVVDNRAVFWKENDGKESGPLSTAVSDSGVMNSTISMAETEPKVHENNFDIHGKLMVSGSSLFSQRHSPSPVDGERLKLDNEVEWLKERLQRVQEEKEKLTCSAEHRKRVNAQLKLVDDILNQLWEIQPLKEPVQWASLPPLSSKVNSRKRHSRSESWENFESA